MFCPVGFTAFISSTVLLIQSSYGSDIIGGKEVKPHSMPFMALVQSCEHQCGGILISESWVLTAAHCKDINMVWLGVHSIKKRIREKNSKHNRTVKKHFPHPSYDEKTLVNDLMLLKLDKPVKQTKTVQWLKLGKTVKDPEAGTFCKVAGWGRTSNNGKQTLGSDVLMSVNVTVIDRKECNSRKYYNRDPTITSGMICAGSDGADTCQGDSGGPLLCNGTLVGVTSFGRKCGDPKHPGVYAFLTAEHLIWINDTMKRNK